MFFLLVGQDSLQWDVGKKEGAYHGEVFAYKVATISKGRWDVNKRGIKDQGDQVVMEVNLADSSSPEVTSKEYKVCSLVCDL